MKTSTDFDLLWRSLIDESGGNRTRVSDHCKQATCSLIQRLFHGFLDDWFISTGDLLSVTYNDQLSECEDRRSDPDQGVDDRTKPDRECRPH